MSHICSFLKNMSVHSPCVVVYMVVACMYYGVVSSVLCTLNSCKYRVTFFLMSVDRSPVIFLRVVPVNRSLQLVPVFAQGD